MPKLSKPETETTIIETVREFAPDVQAIYLYGSYGTEYERAESDVDIGVLLPAERGRDRSGCRLLPLQDSLERALSRDVDAVDLRNVSTVLGFEVVTADRRIFVADVDAADSFEALTLSYYQKLNEEISGIVQEARESSRFYDV